MQTVLLEEGAKAKDDMTQLTLDLDKEYTAKFKSAGVTIVEDVDLNAFQKATAPVYSAFPKWTPGLHDTVMKILANFNVEGRAAGSPPPGRFLPP